MAPLMGNTIKKLPGNIYYSKILIGPENFGAVRTGQTGLHEKGD
jgi:hypothetical protein